MAKFLLSPLPIIGSIFTSLAIFFHQIFLNPTSMLYPASDTRIYSAWKIFLKDSIIRYRELPLWNPYLFGGTPFIGDTQAAIFYPTTLLFLVFPIDTLFGWLFILDFFLIGIFTYLYGRSISLERVFSLYSAFVFMFSGPLIARIFPGHILILDAIVYLPLLLFLWEKFHKSKKLIYAFLTSIAISLMLFSGNAQMAIFNLLIWGIYITTRSALQRNTRLFLTSLAFISISFIISLCIYSVQLFPSIEFSRLSTRSNGLSYEFASSFSLHPKQLISFLLPQFFGSPASLNYWGKGNFWELCGYIGIIPPLLALFSIFRKRTFFTIFFAILSIFSLVYALGRYSFVYDLFYYYVPTFSLFRIPARILYVYAFSIAILSGFGLRELIQLNTQNKQYLYLLTSILTVIICLLAFILNPSNFSTFITTVDIHKYIKESNTISILSLIRNDIVLAGGISIGFIILIIGKITQLLSTRLIQGGITILSLLPLFLLGMSLFTTKNPSEIYKKTAVITYLQNDKDLYRVFDLEGQSIDLASRYSTQSLMGYSPTYLKEYQTYLWQVGKHDIDPHESFFEIYSIDNMQILQYLNTKYIISKFTLSHPNLELVLLKNGQYLYKLKETFPRAYVITSSESSLPDTMEINQARVILYEPNKIVLQANASTSSNLILSENYYPGWNAYVDKKQVPIERFQNIFRKIPIDAGKHTVEFIYSPTSYKIGSFVTYISLIALIILIGIFYKAKIKFV